MYYIYKALIAYNIESKYNSPPPLPPPPIKAFFSDVIYAESWMKRMILTPIKPEFYFYVHMHIHKNFQLKSRIISAQCIN